MKKSFFERPNRRLTGRNIIGADGPDPLIAAEDKNLPEAQHYSVQTLVACSTRPARRLLDFRYAKKLEVLPIGMIEQPVSRLFTVACRGSLSHAERCDLLRSLEFATGERIRLIPVSDSILQGALFCAYHGDESRLAESAARLDCEHSEIKPVDLQPGGAAHGFINDLIAYGLSKQASDIHFVPCRKGTRIRIRINGGMQESSKLVCSLQQHARFARCIKVLARLDTVNCTTPQDGSFQFKAGDQRVSVRVSSMPTIHGERLVLRLLQAGLRCSLADFGYSAGTLRLVEECLTLRNGIILFCGPTGSGKTTALYAATERLSERGLQLCSVEDPIEIDVPWLSQTSLDEAAGLDYATALKALLRQDPDVILVGEIRDESSANIAINAALTGHMLISSLHGGSAAEVLARLKELATTAVDIQRVLNLIVVQRLIPRLCHSCAVFDLAGSRLVGAEVRKPAGCARCDYSGYNGRIVVEEALRITPQLFATLEQGAYTELPAGSYISARENAWQELRACNISIEDYTRLTGSSGLRYSQAEESSMNQLPFRPNVCMLVLNSSDLLFLGERNRSPGIWQFPQGGVESKDSLEENVIRELEEELGIEREMISIIKKLKATHEYEFSDPPKYAIGRWRGQSQTFWLVRFKGSDQDIQLDRHNPEMMNFKWCTPEEVRTLAEPRRLPGYQAPLREVEEYLADQR